MSPGRLALALAAVGVVVLLLPDQAHAWTPGTHIFLGESILANLDLLPLHAGELLRAHPFAFLYGNIAADSSIAKHYAPLGRHCHYWHVGQEIHDLADSALLQAFGLGYLCHLSADTVAHNFFVPRQLMLTSSTAAVGHSYWETRVEAHLGDAYSRTARELIRKHHAEADAHLDRIIAPTIFSVRTNRRLFRGMVRLTESPSWQRASQVAREYSRWRLDDADIEQHLGLSFDFMIGLLGTSEPSPRTLDPSGEEALKSAKQVRRQVLRRAGRRNIETLRTAARDRFGLPESPLLYWPRVTTRLPWHAPGRPSLTTRLSAHSDR